MGAGIGGFFGRTVVGRRIIGTQITFRGHPVKTHREFDVFWLLNAEVLEFDRQLVANLLKNRL